MIRWTLFAALAALAALPSGAIAKERRASAEVIYALTRDDVTSLATRNGIVLSSAVEPSAAERAANPEAGIGPTYIGITGKDSPLGEHAIVLTLRSCGEGGFGPDECLGLIIARPFRFAPATRDQALSAVNHFHERTSFGRGFVSGDMFFVEYYLTTDQGITEKHADRMLSEILAKVPDARSAVAASMQR